MTESHDTTPMIVVTDAARVRVHELLLAEARPNLMLRMFVNGGGCSGFQYGFRFEEHPEADDHQIDCSDFTLLVDAMSMQYLVGATLDYVDDITGTQMVVRNPNVTGSCGCGSSFTV
jgi:iron-sulfur cluster insertion protein